MINPVAVFLLMGIAIRRAEISDLEALSTLANLAFQAAFGHLASQEEMDEYLAELRPECWQTHLVHPNIQIWLAEQSGQLMGYLQLETHETHPSVQAKNPMWLHRIYLHPAHTGGGLGGLLMEHAIRLAETQAHDALWLTVWDLNPKAIAFYARHGFRKVDYIAYPIGSDAPATDFLMQRDCGGLRIIPYHPRFARDFDRLNRAWITQYFDVEAKDEKVLRSPKSEIIDIGGEIFFLIQGGKVLGTMAMSHLSTDQVELNKLAVAPEAQGKGLGKQLVEAGLAYARAKRYREVILWTNTRLEVACTLYLNLGFQIIETPPQSDYARANCLMAYDLT